MYKITPVSVIDLERTKIKKRTNKIKDNHSSRTGFSAFPTQIGDLCADFFCRDATLVFDPFAGWGERHKCCENCHLAYIGFDKSQDAIIYADKTFNVKNYLNDSLEAEIPYHDALITCPPYFNIEKYNGAGISDAKTYEEFLNLYKEILKRCSEKTLPNATYCIMVGDWRLKGIFYNLSYDTEKIMYDLGFKIHDKVICNQKKTANWRIMMVNAKKFLYTAKVHQYLLVFKK